MHFIRATRRRNLWALVMMLVLVIAARADDKKKNPPPPPKAAPAARPAARPSGGAPAGNRAPSANGGGAYRPAGGAPTANHPVANRPPSANSAAPRPGAPANPGIRNEERMPGNQGRAPGLDRPAMNRIDNRPAPHGARPMTLRNGSALERRPNGRISDVHDAARGMSIHHGLDGHRRVVVDRPDHSRIFAERGRPGYIQHPYAFHGHDFARRAYYFHGRAYQRFYRDYRFHGVAIEVYAPARYYPVGFYGWAYNPWRVPVVYTWGWGASPWAGYYGFYFTPYPAYPSAPLWLTDYIISQDLQAEYEAGQQDGQMAAADQGSGAPVLTPDIKQQIADEVRNQIALENYEAQQNAQNQDPDPSSSGIARLLADGHSHVFVAGSPLDVVDSSGTECAISSGDALELQTAPPADAEVANLQVLASKGGKECPRSDTVTVALSDLQEMQNHMRETIDQGLEQLRAKQGSDGLPPAPPSAQAPPQQVAFAQIAPPPDPNGAAEVNEQLQQADTAEKDVVAQAQQESGAPVTVAPGQTPDQVTQVLGQPTRIIDLGSRKIYQYSDTKVTFLDGKVTEVQ